MYLPITPEKQSIKDQLTWMALVEQKRDNDYEEDLFCRLFFIFLSLKVCYCKCWWKKSVVTNFFVFTNNPRKTDQLSWTALVEQKRDDDYEEDMFCRLLFIFLSLAQSLRPFVRQVSRSTVTHSLSKMHCIQTIGLAFNGHTQVPPSLDGASAPRADNSIGPDVPENPIIFY